MVPKLALVRKMEESASVAESILMFEAIGPTVEDDVANLVEGSEDDNEDLNIEEDNNDIRSTKPSHMNFSKLTIKGGYIEVLTKSHCIGDASLVRLGGRTPHQCQGKMKWWCSEAF